MIDLRKDEIVIVDGLKSYLSTSERPCEVVRQNQVAEVPPYPYSSYTSTSVVSEHQGTYAVADDGTLFKSVTITFSFTVQSDDKDEAVRLAFRAYDFFSVVGVQYLADHGISVIRVRDVTARDNLLSIQYEYRNGLDVTFGLLSKITPEDQIFSEVIEHFDLKKEE